MIKQIARMMKRLNMMQGCSSVILCKSRILYLCKKMYKMYEFKLKYQIYLINFIVFTSPAAEKNLLTIDII